MIEYLTESAYQRWYKQYQDDIRYYLEELNQLKLQVAALPYDEEIEILKMQLYAIEENLETLSPRNFKGDGKPLEGFEKFLENMRVFINLLYRVMGKSDCYEGIYQNEKNKILDAHQEFQFKERLQIIKEQIEWLEAKNHQDVEAVQKEESSLITQQG